MNRYDATFLAELSARFLGHYHRKIQCPEIRFSRDVQTIVYGYVSPPAPNGYNQIYIDEANRVDQFTLQN